MSRVLSLAMFLLCVFVATTQAAERFDLDAMMSQSDQESSGVDHLNPSQRRALESWIDLWTVKALNALLEMGCRCSAHECLEAIYHEEVPSHRRRQEPSLEARMRDERERRRLSEEQSHTIDEKRIPEVTPHRERLSPSEKALKKAQEEEAKISRIMDGGREIRLSDGSVWYTAPQDRSRASNWRTGDKIQTQSGSGPGRLTLYNVERRQSIEVSASRDSTRQTDPFGQRWYEENRQATIRKVSKDGKEVIMSNGAVYEISFGDARRYARHWSAGAVVEVIQKSGLYPFAIKNLNNGDTVQARFKR